jgi:hypothetical protein
MILHLTSENELISYICINRLKVDADYFLGGDYKHSGQTRLISGLYISFYSDSRMIFIYLLLLSEHMLFISQLFSKF